MKRQGGFTILETTLVLGISAALFAMAFGIITLIARQRFNDTMVSLRNAIQAEYEEVRHGINPRQQANICGIDTIAGASANDCLVMGKVIRFENNRDFFETSYVVGTGARVGAGINWDSWPNLGNLNLNDEQAIRNTRLQVVGDMGIPGINWERTYLKWGGRIENSRAFNYTNNDLRLGANLIAILRSPISSSITVFATNTTMMHIDGVLELEDFGSWTHNTVAILIRNSQRGFQGGAICIDPNSVSTSTRMTLPADPHEIGLSNLRALCERAI